MTEKERLQEQKEEAIARLACLDYEDNAGGLPDSPDWVEFEKVLSEAALPPEMVWNGKAKRALRNYRLGEAHRTVRLHWRVAAIAAALLVLLASISYAHYQEDIHNFIMTITDQYFTVGNQNTDETKYFDLTGIYAPQYIPEGFQLVRKQASLNCVALEYERDETEIICFQQVTGKAGMLLDADSETNITVIQINGMPGGLAIKTDGTVLVFWGEKRQFLIRGTVSGTELIKMAESVVFVPKGRK